MKKKSLAFLFTGIFFFFFYQEIFSLEQISLVEGVSRYPLGKYLEILEDPQQEWTIEEVSSPPLSSRFVKNKKQIPNFGKTHSAYWVRFSVKNTTPNLDKMILEMSFFQLKQITTYLSSGNSWKTKYFQEIFHPHFLFFLTIPENQEQVIYMRFVPRRSLQLPLTLWDSKKFLEKTTREIWGMGIFLGILFSMFFYNLFLYFSTRERNRLYYVCYVFFVTLFLLNSIGLGAQYFWLHYPFWAEKGTILFICMQFIFIILFVQSFFHQDTPLLFYPYLFRVFQIFYTAVVIFYSQFHLAFLFPSFGIISACLILLILVFAIHLCFKRNRNATIFLIAWIVLIGGLFLTILQRIGVISPSFLTDYGVYFGAVLEVTLLSFSLGNRLNIVSREKEKIRETNIRLREKVSRQLEEQVRQRTQALQELNEKLEEENRFRIEKEKELSQTKQKIESASQAKGRFLANMSHEIRSPLNVILGLSQVLLVQVQKLSLPASFVEPLKNIHISGKLLLELVNNILDLSKIEIGKMKVLEESFSLEELILSLCDLFGSQIQQKEISLFREIHPDLPPYLCSDRKKVFQILTNLVGNAIKFSPEKKNIWIKAEKEGKKLVIRVVDEGVGIPEDQLQKIFDKFKQVDGSITRTFGGTGLGLAISQKLAELLDGEIQVESKLRNGSAFSLVFPLKEGEASTKGMNSVSFRLPKFTKDPLVLVVEDNPLNQATIEALLEEIGLSIILAENGKIGVEKALELKPDLIFMDLHMPVISGYEALEELQSNPEWNDSPIVALSGDAFPEQQEKMKEAGFSHYLTKPVTMEQLIPLLTKLLRSEE